jgi:hypothetical protein
VQPCVACTQMFGIIRASMSYYLSKSSFCFCHRTTSRLVSSMTLCNSARLELDRSGALSFCDAACMICSESSSFARTEASRVKSGTKSLMVILPNSIIRTKSLVQRQSPKDKD